MNNLKIPNKMGSLFLALTALFFVSACNDDDSGSKNSPTELNITITKVGADGNNPDGNGSGIIQLTATATNAVRYAFRLESGDQQQSEDGTIEYAVTNEGINSYTFVAWAFSDSGEFITETVATDIYKSDQEFFDLVFSDEFEGSGSPDAEKWHYQVIPPDNGSWHNGELQHYTARDENSFVSDGTLKIKALKEEYTYEGSTKSYTSARLNSKFKFKYGRVDVRAKLPASAGTWPAIWTLGANSNEIGNYYGDEFGAVGWPLCGEIDILEQKGSDKDHTITHFHWGDLNTGVYNNSGAETAVPNTSSEFHVYSMQWNSESVKIFVDDEMVYELPNSDNKPFNHDHYLLLNQAIGGSLGGDVPADFTEDTFEVDYVRVYQ